MSTILFIESNTTGTGTSAMVIAGQLGYRIEFWTSDPGLYKRLGTDSPLEIADSILRIDTYDIAAMLKAVKKSKNRIVGILAFDDYHLIPVCELASEIGCPGHTAESLSLTRFKHLTRDHLAKNQSKVNIKQPRYQIITSTGAYDHMEIGFPCVLKPVDDSGSNGISICKNEEELREAIEIERDRTVNERGYRLTRQWLIEEYIEGQEYSAEMLYENDQWKLISITKKETYGNHAVECGHVTSKKIDTGVVNIDKHLRDLLKVFQLEFGAAHIEFKVKNDIPYLIEINPRLAGGCIPDLVKIATGIDMVEHLLKQSVNENHQIIETKNKEAAIYFAIPNKIGVYINVKNVEKINEINEINKIEFVEFPFEVTKITSSYHRLGYVICESEKSGQAFDIAKSAINLLDWELENE